MKKQLLTYALAFICINTVIVSTVNANCNTPSSVSANGISTTSAMFNWAPVPGALSYHFQYHKLGSATWISGTSSTSNYRVDGLTENAEYEYQVQTMCSGCSSPFTEAYKFRTLNRPVSAPAGISANSITPASAG